MLELVMHTPHAIYFLTSSDCVYSADNANLNSWRACNYCLIVGFWEHFWSLVIVDFSSWTKISQPKRWNRT